ncbi:MAG: hypothetical protein AAF696_36160 [Bacteroidota bacterium]
METVSPKAKKNYLARIILGVLTLLISLPPINFFISFFLHFSILPFSLNLGVFSGIIYLGLLIYYMMKVLDVETLGTRSKTLWVIRFILVGFISMPIFWYFFVWQKEEYALFLDEDEKAEQLIDELGNAPTE